MKVLIVEDNKDDRLLLKYILEKNGFEVIEAADGQEGLDMTSLHKPNLIISDANMPRMDGFQFLRKVKQNEVLREIPFIFYSAVYTGYREAELAISLGAEAFIIKPKEPSQFMEELNIIIEESGKKKTITAELIGKDEEFLREYSKIVASKLEEKVRELEGALSELKKMEESLLKSEARLQSVFRTAPVGIGLLSDRRILLQVNDRLCEMLGYASDELVGKSAEVFYLSGEEFEQVCREEGKRIKETGTVTLETRWKRKDDSVTDVLFSCSPIDSGEPSLGTTFTAFDITARKRVEDELKKRVKELEDFYEIAIERELRIKELKERVDELEEELKKCGRRPL